jgi:pimeloyl-ACP methyl ester carboxylesterase
MRFFMSPTTPRPFSTRWLPVAALLIALASGCLRVSHAADAPPGHTATLPGVDLYYTDTGAAPGRDTVILLHPNTGTSAIWRDQSLALARAGFRAIAFDRRGWGQSRARSAEDNGAASIAEDLEQLVRHLGIERFHLLGIAGGGFASLDYAAWQPQRIKSLIIGGSTGQLSDPSMLAVVARLEIPGIRKVDATYREVGPSYRARDPQGTARWLEIEEHAQQPGAKAQKLHTLNTLAKISTLRMPALLIAGGADLLAPLRSCACGASSCPSTSGS